MAGTGTAYPADGSPTFTSIQGRNAYSAAMAGATSARPLGGISGVRPGTPSNTITATSTTWTMNPNGFAGYIDLESSATNSGYFFAFSGTITGTVTAAGGSARTDIVWVRISDPNTSDGSTGTPRVELDYTANTTTPPARAFVIAQINVPATGGGSPTVTWIAPYAVAAGAIQPVLGTSTYPSAPYDGEFWYDQSTHQLKFYNGTKAALGLEDTDWIAPTLVNSWTNFGSGLASAGYRRMHGRVQLRGTLTGGATGSGNNLFVLPAGFRPAAALRFLAISSTSPTVIQLLADGSVQLSGNAPSNTSMAIDGISFIAEA